jgi:hypothetical protein
VTRRAKFFFFFSKKKKKREKLFVGRFETLNGKEVKLEGVGCFVRSSSVSHSLLFGKGNKLSTGEGWSVAAECRILFEELFYNKSWQKFRVVCIDRALVGGVPPG